MTLISWSWFFLVIYIGWHDNHRGCWPSGASNTPMTLPRRVARTALCFWPWRFRPPTVSGATFLGMPGLSYTWGLTTMWTVFLTPGRPRFGHCC